VSLCVCRVCGTVCNGFVVVSVFQVAYFLRVYVFGVCVFAAFGTL